MAVVSPPPFLRRPVPCRPLAAPTITSGRPASQKEARREHIYLDARFSDHAPLIIDYDISP
jgi:hypothetical protein